MSNYFIAKLMLITHLLLNMVVGGMSFKLELHAPPSFARLWAPAVV